MFIKCIEIIKLECFRHYQKRVRARLQNLKKKKRTSWEGSSYRYPNWSTSELWRCSYLFLKMLGTCKIWNQFFSYCFMLFQMKAVCTTIHIAPLIWIVGANTLLVEPITQKLINLGQIFQKTLFIKWGLYIFLELSKDTKSEKCLNGKTQDANESFNGTTWERIRRNYLI